MTFEERLDRITERHESLAITVELLAGSMRDLAAAQESLAMAQESTERRLTRAIALSVREARRERERRREDVAEHDQRWAELDAKLKKLADEHAKTELLLQRFLARGGNGHS
jgi:chromosome segregation ATPase